MRWKFFRWSVLVIFATLYLVLFYALNFLRPSEYIGCDSYTEYMNGGVHTFEEKDYNIELCGLDGAPGVIKNWGGPDEIRLKVFAMDGELLAERFFNPSGMAPPLGYGDDNLTYWHVTGDTGQEKKILIPPSRWEWIRARLPRLWP